MRPRNVVLLAALLALASLPIVASAQETTGTISGRVTDPQGLAVPGVTVTVTGPQGSKTAVTDTDGRYQVPYLVPGSYSVKAELQGFKTVQQSDVLLRLSQTADVPMTMQVGGVTETVDVQGSTPVVDTTSTTIGASLDSALLERVPIGRRFSDTLVHRAGRRIGRVGRHSQPLGVGRERPRQPVRDRRGQREQRRVRRAGLVLDRVRLARQRHTLRLHAGSAGEDRRVRGRVRTGDRRRDQRHHQERVEQPLRQPVRLFAAAAARERLHADRIPEWHRQHRQHPRERCRRGDRRTASARPGVLLRRDRSELGSAHDDRADEQERRRNVGVPAQRPRQRQPRTPGVVVRGEGHLAVERQQPVRRLVLRRPGQGPDGSAAQLRAAGHGHVVVQRDQQVRRPQPDRPLLRHAHRQMAARGFVRPGPQRGAGDPVGQHLARDRHPGDAADRERWYRVLRGRQQEQQLPVPRHGHQSRWWARAEVRRDVRHPDLRPDQPADRTDVRHARLATRPPRAPRSRSCPIPPLGRSIA